MWCVWCVCVCVRGVLRGDVFQYAVQWCSPLCAILTADTGRGYSVGVERGKRSQAAAARLGPHVTCVGVIMLEDCVDERRMPCWGGGGGLLLPCGRGRP